MKFQNLSKPAADDRILGRHLNVAFFENRRRAAARLIVAFGGGGLSSYPLVYKPLAQIPRLNPETGRLS